MSCVLSRLGNLRPASMTRVLCFLDGIRRIILPLKRPVQVVQSAAGIRNTGLENVVPAEPAGRDRRPIRNSEGPFIGYASLMRGAGGVG